MPLELIIITFLTAWVLSRHLVGFIVTCIEYKTEPPGA